MTNRRGFLGALAALVAAPVTAKAAPRPTVPRLTWWPDPPNRYRFVVNNGVIKTFQSDNSPWSDIRRSAARLRAIRRFA